MCTASHSLFESNYMISLDDKLEIELEKIKLEQINAEKEKLKEEK
jgi:hypothetical protein